jgi:hypothetical protein
MILREFVPAAKTALSKLRLAPFFDFAGVRVIAGEVATVGGTVEAEEGGRVFAAIRPTSCLLEPEFFTVDCLEEGESVTTVFFLAPPPRAFPSGVGLAVSFDCNRKDD